MKAKLARTAFEYGVITVATLLLVVGVYFFKFPNNFSFGGVTGIAVVLSAMSKASASSYTFIINMAALSAGRKIAKISSSTGSVVNGALIGNIFSSADNPTDVNTLT